MVLTYLYMCMSVYWSLCEFVWVQAKTMKLCPLFQETRNKVPRLDQFRSINYGPKLVEPILVTTLIQILFITHSLHSLSSSAGDGGGEGLNLQPDFQKGGVDRTSTFRRGLLRKRGWLISEGELQFSHKKIKSEIFNDKQSL